MRSSGFVKRWQSAGWRLTLFVLSTTSCCLLYRQRMAQTPFLNPSVPFVGPIQNGLRQGTLISIQGTSFPSSNRICINLQVGPNVAPRDSVALHVALDFTRNLIIRNTIQGQNWGVEESYGPPISLIRGVPFKLDILCDTFDYKIAFNGSHFAEMKHRIPFQSVFYVAVDGEAQLHSIQINASGSTMPIPGCAPGYMATPGHMPMPGQMPMPGNPSGYMPSAGQMPMHGVPGSVPPFASGYSAYPGQTQNSPYLHKHSSSPIKNALNQGLANYAMTGHISPQMNANRQGPINIGNSPTIV